MAVLHWFSQTEILSVEHTSSMCMVRRAHKEIRYHGRIRDSDSRVNLTPSLKVVGVISSVWISLVISIDISAGDTTPRST